MSDEEFWEWIVSSVKHEGKGMCYQIYEIVTRASIFRDLTRVQQWDGTSDPFAFTGKPGDE